MIWGLKLREPYFLLFGAIDGRKGIHQILDAIQKLSSDWGRQLCLVLVGESKIQQQLEARITEITASQPVQIIRNYQFVSEEEVWSYFRMSDVILATYQKHVGMSGILLLAAATQKPVLSTDFGLMGAMVKQHQLGLSIDSTQPEQISEGMMKLIGASRNDFYNPEKMRIWAKQNSAENFAQTIFAGITNND
ncbi:glycosyltransferase [Acaryochloris sp. 'Moss Beach']|uniref:glycosyltransferase n=1 Tax=Acaryochloris sp. 'Moss Beach' TaxID=2740837 RepID=UPI001F3BF89D|nr:glycosyltransferase [Acaryochloris sp. 'Moss Beach']